MRGQRKYKCKLMSRDGTACAQRVGHELNVSSTEAYTKYENTLVCAMLEMWQTNRDQRKDEVLMRMHTHASSKLPDGRA